jgi:glycosyltransferase involved in cell wall biosynthesis
MPKLTLLVPVFNEAQTLRSVIAFLLQSPCTLEREWIFIDDNSTDGSTEILVSEALKYGFKLIKQTKNIGKGHSVICGIKEATGDFIMIQDADFEYDPVDISTLLVPLLEGKADVVYGSRFKKSSYQVHRTTHYFINRLLTLLSNLLSGIYLTDMETCYKIFRADLLKAMNLQSKRFGIEVELTAFIAKVRARIYELPISYFPRTKLQGKKINWKDGFAALYHLVRFNQFTSTQNAFNKDYLELIQKKIPNMHVSS